MCAEKLEYQVSFYFYNNIIVNRLLLLLFYSYLYFQPITHGFIHADSIIIDGETHRAKLQARETLQTLNSVIDFEVIDVHVAPELMLQEVEEPNFRTDVWSTTAVILEFLLGLLYNKLQ